MNSKLQQVRPGSDRLLVVIASYGNRNDKLLRKIIDDYQRMALHVDVVVVSNIAKDLGPRVEVVVGLPSANPWSLPFAHRAIFARNADRYDLFAYSEDDMSITDKNIRAFQDASDALDATEIAGFLRYEVAPSGSWSLPDIHGGYRWKPESVRRRGNYTLAEFSNEHAAFYLLTHDQLRRMIAADGFVRSPYEGRYDMLCAAATDPYTAYGFRKVICISNIDDFLIHHRSNRYAGKVGVPLATLRRQAQTLIQIAEGRCPATTLITADSRWPQSAWAKDLYELPSDEVLGMVPGSARTILSIGCGWGATEEALLKRGASVTTLPMDAVLGAIASDRGLRVEVGTFEDCVSRLGSNRFDCVVVTNILHLLLDWELFLNQCAQFVSVDGSLVVTGPNFGSIRVLAKRMLNKRGYRKLRSFQEGGITALGPSMLKQCLERAGLVVSLVRWSDPPTIAGPESKLGRWGRTRWAIRACRTASSKGHGTLPRQVEKR